MSLKWLGLFQIETSLVEKFLVNCLLSCGLISDFNSHTYQNENKYDSMSITLKQTYLCLDSIIFCAIQTEDYLN